MSVSTDAHFFFGACWDTELSEIELFEEMDVNYKGLNDWLVDQGIQDVEYGTHCSTQAPMPFIAISETHVEAYRGKPKKVTRLRGPELVYRERVELVLTRLGIPQDEWPEIGWFLVSDTDLY